MQRLTQKNINTAEEYDRIFEIRQKKEVDEFDLRRWKTLIKYYKFPDAIIDIGCLDSGIPSLFSVPPLFGNDWVPYMGIDIAQKAIAEMQKKYKGFHFQVKDLYYTEFQDGFFDYAVLGEVLEHLEDPEKAIHESMRILKSKGTLAISVPLDESKEPGAVDGERHLWSYTEKDMHDLLDKYGKVEIEILGSIREPEYKYCWPQMIVFCKKK